MFFYVSFSIFQQEINCATFLGRSFPVCCKICVCCEEAFSSFICISVETTPGIGTALAHERISSSKLCRRLSKLLWQSSFWDFVCSCDSITIALPIDSVSCSSHFCRIHHQCTGTETWVNSPYSLLGWETAVCSWTSLLLYCISAPQALKSGSILHVYLLDEYHTCLMMIRAWPFQGFNCIIFSFCRLH